MLDNLRLKNLLQHSSSNHAQGPYSWHATRGFITYSDCILWYVTPNFVDWSYFLMVSTLLCCGLSPGQTGFVSLRSSHLRLVVPPLITKALLSLLSHVSFLSLLLCRSLNLNIFIGGRSECSQEEGKKNLDSFWYLCDYHLSICCFH